jgi:hypothetical protein
MPRKTPVWLMAISALPVLERRLRERRGVEDARVVEQHVDATLLGDHALDDLGPARG